LGERLAVFVEEDQMRPRALRTHGHADAVGSLDVAVIHRDESFHIRSGLWLAPTDAKAHPAFIRERGMECPSPFQFGEGIGALCANSSFSKRTRNDWRSLLRQLLLQ
jgi:hypothetical protein